MTAAAHTPCEPSGEVAATPPTEPHTCAANNQPLAAREKLQLGFLRIVESAAGDVGGLLVTNRLGRPLEFQCTTPVKANRTQEILYGRTLRPFLHSELIGKTLVERLQVKPDVILIDDAALLDLRAHVDIPVACLCGETNDLPDQTCVQLGNQSVNVHIDHQSDSETIASFVGHITADADLTEPLDRVREALLEAARPGAVAS